LNEKYWIEHLGRFTVSVAKITIKLHQ